MSKRTINHVLILGATSDLATALAAQFAMRQYTVTLAGRDLGRLSVIGSDLHIRYSVPVNILRFDGLDFKSHYEFYHRIKQKPDVVVCVFFFRPAWVSE
jgi:short-subunit dehydrogenase